MLAREVTPCSYMHLYVAITATSRQWCALGLVGCDVCLDNSHVTLLISSRSRASTPQPANRNLKTKHSLVIARRDFFIDVRDTTISPYHNLTRGTHTATLYCLSQYPGSLTAPFSLSSTQHSASPRS